MPTTDKYAVIKNPMRPFFQYEVWVSGNICFVENDGYGLEMKTRTVARKVKTFQTEQKATKSIRYWQEIAAFKEQANG